MSLRREPFTAEPTTSPATPTAVRRVSGTQRIGLGGIGDFNAIISTDSSAAAAWNQIQGQLSAENSAGLVPQGAYGTLIAGAQSDFADAYAGLQSAKADVTQIVGAAQQYAVQARSVLGAVANVQGFIQAASSPEVPPQELVSSFTGIVIGVAIAAGAVSAGVGAAVVGGVALAVTALSSAGFFPAAPQGRPLCDGSVHVTGGPGSLVVGCVAGQYAIPENATVPGPQDNRWRSFPEPSSSPLWYVPVVSPGSSLAQPISWGGGSWGSGTNGPRMVDAAFPQFRHLECEQTQLGALNLPPSAQSFSQAYFSAWKMNAALLLNGQKAADDVTVLRQLVATWNLAHTSGNDFTFPTSGTYLPSPGIGGDVVRNCADVRQYGSYISYLASAYGAPVTIHGGALKNPPKTMLLTNNVPGGGSTTLGRKLAAGLVWSSVIALGGTAAYAVATKTPVTVVWQRFFNDIASYAKSPLRTLGKIKL